MWIHEAVKKALENNQCITLPEFLGTSKIKVLQTKSQENYISYSGQKGSSIDGQPIERFVCHKGGSGDNV